MPSIGRDTLVALTVSAIISTTYRPVFQVHAIANLCFSFAPHISNQTYVVMRTFNRP